jgi:ABC-type Fe3+-siderophore transport system permease subunit
MNAPEMVLDPAARTASTSRPMRVTGLVISGLAAAFLLMDGVLRLVGFAPYVEGTVRGGYPASLGPAIALVLIASTLLYVLPRTAVLGAILVTGYLGGATATNLRTTDPFLFPVVFGVFVWAGLYLRDARLRALIPLRRDTGA